jgi:AcrR family transcriptional regulator
VDAFGMEKNIKQRIIDEAVSTFNAQGYGNSSLQDIARKLNISRGNLAYHFASKDALLETIFQQMWAKIEAERKNSRNLPSFQNLRQEIDLYWEYQKKYAFIFTDSQVMILPAIKKSLREMALTTIEDNKAAIAFAIKVGNMKPEPYPGVYHQVALTVWMLMFFWLPQQIVCGTTKGDDAEKTVWSMLLPHFTAKGIAVFKKYYGEEFLQSLGPAFEFSSDELLVF